MLVFAMLLYISLALQAYSLVNPNRKDNNWLSALNVPTPITVSLFDQPRTADPIAAHYQAAVMRNSGCLNNVGAFKSKKWMLYCCSVNILWKSGGFFLLYFDLKWKKKQSKHPQRTICFLKQSSKKRLIVCFASSTIWNKIGSLAAILPCYASKTDFTPSAGLVLILIPPYSLHIVWPLCFLVVLIAVKCINSSDVGWVLSWWGSWLYKWKRQLVHIYVPVFSHPLPHNSLGDVDSTVMLFFSQFVMVFAPSFSGTK